jgi:acetoin utilization deacetylase AcuC-like enzyme
MGEATATTALLFNEEGLLHLTGPGHPERPARLEVIRGALVVADLWPPNLAIRPAARDDLLRVHTAEHIDTIEDTCAGHGFYPDPDTTMSKGSWAAALTAAGAGITACEAVLEGRFRNAFCAVRPPGHHAEGTHAMGFCLFNNVAIAARWLRAVRGLDRVAILDWDVHHGNGTQHTFYDDASVYYASIHQWPHYPGTGLPEERGAENTNLNLTMAPGSGAEAWLEAINRQVLPEFARFRPDFLLISCGFDAHRRDPLGGQYLETETFAEMTRRVREVAGGRLVSLLEGGYDLHALGESVVAHVRALQGV